jgi:phage terminase large subunit
VVSTVARVSILDDLIKPYPRQRQFLETADTHEYTLFGGAAGPGKSRTLRWWLIRLLHRWYRDYGLTGVHVGLFCEDYRSLEDRHLSKIRSEFPQWLGSVREVRKEFWLKPEYGSGVIAFRNLDDPSKYLSVEFAAIAVDELTRNKREVFDVLRSRKRWPGIEFSPFAAATNPGGIGHQWVKTLWIDRDFSGELDDELDPEDFAFVPARADDNPSLPKSYNKTLASLPLKLRKAYRDGSWDMFEGQFFPEFSRDVHVIEPFIVDSKTGVRHPFRIPPYVDAENPGWPRWQATDYGYSAPSCTLWAARAPKTGNIYIYRERYETEKTADQQALKVKLWSTGEVFRNRVLDPACWARESNGRCIADQFAAVGWPLAPATNDRLAGWLKLRELLAWRKDGDEGEAVGFPPKLFIFARCTNLIRELSSAVHDKQNVEDLDTNGSDHGLDAARYLIMAMDVQPDSSERATAQKWSLRKRPGA